ncbi:MAG: TOBE domain-containing protein, partial [Gemmatimonadales bacterium]
HDQEDAFDLGDRVAVLRGGKLEQVGTPDQLYLEPASPFVAGFVGRSSRLDAILEESGADRVFVRIGKVRLMLPGPRPPQPPGPVVLVARPEAWRMIEPKAGDLQGPIVARRFTGALAYFAVQVVHGVTVEVAAESGAARIGDRVGLLPHDRGIHLFRGDAR